MRTSIFDLFKIGIGPSSSHTVGPMRAALRFVEMLHQNGDLQRAERVCAELYGSLALTGIGHGTDRAILLGLSGETPEQIEPSSIDPLVTRIRVEQRLSLLGVRPIVFHPDSDLLFHHDSTLPGHPNGMRFTAFDQRGNTLASDIYYSIGGGFIVKEGAHAPDKAASLLVPHPFSSGAELLDQAESKHMPVWQLILENESALRGEPEVRRRISQIWSVMDGCIERGLRTEGILPGGLSVRRRAPRLLARIQSESGTDPLRAMDWVNVFAMAVNEENAAGGRVVTAPTNGAAGLIPAVGR
ncbi:MAG: L-serine ammonia-lyase, partial [Acidobacteriaceae bacterium]|nr:L-serine ammonia-lyase [Acidobacteriaceae bacterium]